MTATTGRTVLAIVAILSLLLSAFAIARPVIASHGGAHLQTGQQGTSWDDEGQNANCPAGDLARINEGEVLWHFILTDPSADSAILTAYFDTDGDGIADLTKVQASEPRQGNGALHFYVVTNEATLIDAQTDIAGGNLVLSHICNEIGEPSIDVTKTGPALSKVGDPTPYTITITNDGGRVLNITEVSDTLAGDLTAAVVAQCGPLAVDEVCVYNYSYTPLASAPDPLLNTVTVTANDSSATAVSDTASASVNLFQPSISVDKTGPATAEVGEEITYTVTITNTSSADSPNLVFDSVIDTLAGDLTGAITTQCGELSPTEVCAFDYTYTVQASDSDPLNNTVMVQTNPAGFPNDIDGSDSHQVDILVPSLTVEKSGPPQSKVGDPTPYTITITNTGDLVLTITDVSDSLAGDLTDDVVAECGELAIAEACDFEYSYTPDAEDPDQLVNEVTVTASTASGTSVNDSDSATVDLFQPDIEVTKVGDVTEAAVGDDVTYTVTIENTSSLDSPDLDFDAISDSLQGDLTDAANYDTSDCDATLAAGDSCTIVYTRTVLETDVSPLVNTVNVESHPEGFPNDIDDSDEFSVVIEEEAEEGSITIDKQLEECETCEAYTPGYWFNRGGGGGVDWANEWLGLNPQTIAGLGTFDSVESVQAFLDADRAQEGAKGLSATGQLLRHYLALVLNVAFAEANDCDLASLTYGEGTIADWLDAALTALESDASDDDKREIKDALDAINNSDAGDGTLECGDSEAGPHAGVMFELYDAEDQLVDSGSTGVDGSLLLDGDPDGSGLPLGTYTLVEVSNDADLECTIVSVSGDGATLNEDGTVTIVLAEGTADVTIIVVNDCEEQPGEEDEFGHISVVKETDEAVATESFSFTATWDADGFTLMDGDLEPSGDLLAGADYTVTEVLSPAQVAAGWSLDDIECTGAATWSVSGDGMSVTITLGVDEDVVCTFTNELEDQPGEGTLEIDKIFCVTSGEAETEFFVFEPTIPESMSTQNVLEDEQPDEGCWTQDVAFTITGGDLAEPVHVTTGDDGIVEVDLPASENAYTITEDLSGESDEFWVEEGALTVVLVINWIPEEIGNGTVKVIKLFCETDDAAEAGVTFQVEGADVAVPVLQGCTPGNATFEFGDDTFSVGSDGLAIFTADVGEYDFAETAPNAAVYSGTVPVVEDGYTTVIVFNTFVEGEQGGNPGTNPGGGVTPGQSQTPREGTAGGNPLPNTATTPAPGGSLPAIVLALMALGALAMGGQRMAAEARSRR